MKIISRLAVGLAAASIAVGIVRLNADGTGQSQDAIAIDADDTAGIVSSLKGLRPVSG